MLQIRPVSDKFAGEFLAVYRETIDALYRSVSRRCGGDRALAEDITQETYLRAIGYWRERGVPNEPLAWLRTVSRNILLNHWRKRQPGLLDGAELDAFLEQREPAVDIEDPELASAVQWALARINTKQARVIEAFYFEERSMKEIAGDEHVTERAVEGLLRRARQALRQKLERHVQDRSGGVQ